MEFLGEEAEDGGGLKQEFWACIAKDIKKCFEGKVDWKIPLHDVIGLQVHSCMCLCVCAYVHIYECVCIYKYLYDYTFKNSLDR